MSTTPEPMTEERLAEIEGRIGRDRDREDVPTLLAEVRRLRAEEHPHGCVEAGEMLKARLDRASDLLLERARQADQLIAQRDEALAQLAEYRTRIEHVRNNYQHSEDCPLHGYVEEEDDAGTQFPESDCDCSTGAVAGLLNLTPARALDLQRARRAVVEAARSWRDVSNAEDQGSAAYHLADFVDALKKLEGPTC